MSKSEKSNIRSVLRLLGPSDIEEYSEERDYIAPQKLAVGGETFDSAGGKESFHESVEPVAEPITFRDFLKQEESEKHPRTFKKLEKEKEVEDAFYFEHIDLLRSSSFKIMLIDAFKLYMEEADKEFFSPDSDIISENKPKNKKQALVYSSQGILINKKF